MESVTADELLGILARGRETSAMAKLAYMLALRSVRAGDGFPSVPRLAGLLGVTERRVVQVLTELIAIGEVVKLRRGEWALAEDIFRDRHR